MKRAFLLGMALSMLAGTWQASIAQTPKPAKSKKTAQSTPVPGPAPIETATAPEAAADTALPTDTATADTTHHKKKGLFGKAKSVMSNKVVKAVVKTAACTMVPGGQMIAGAIDAAGSQSAGEAASGAAAAATGTSCMPGMGGMGGAAGAGLAGAGLTGAGMAGVGMGGRGAGLAGVAGAGLAAAMTPGVPPTAAGYAPGTMGGYGMGGDQKPMADCMGLTVDEFNAMTNPTNGEPRQPTKAEMKRASQLNKKVGAERSMACQQQVGMQQQQAQMAQMQQMMAMAQARGGMPPQAPAMDGGGAIKTEAPGQEVTLADDLAAELKKGKTAVRGIDWVAGSADVSAVGRPGFDAAMTSLGKAIKESGQRYRLDLYLDQRYDDATIATFAPARLQLLQSALGTAAGNPAAAPEIGKTKRDKNPRLELVKIK
ncbi:MAG TPA: hypothetical protein VIG08_09505 [Gemmatimonadales bacterium]|jgi:hypothetical protein